MEAACQAIVQRLKRMELNFLALDFDDTVSDESRVTCRPTLFIPAALSAGAGPSYRRSMGRIGG